VNARAAASEAFLLLLQISSFFFLPARDKERSVPVLSAPVARERREDASFFVPSPFPLFFSRPIFFHRDLCGRV